MSFRTPWTHPHFKVRPVPRRAGVDPHPHREGQSLGQEPQLPGPWVPPQHCPVRQGDDSPPALAGAAHCLQESGLLGGSCLHTLPAPVISAPQQPRAAPVIAGLLWGQNRFPSRGQAKGDVCLSCSLPPLHARGRAARQGRKPGCEEPRCFLGARGGWERCS